MKENNKEANDKHQNNDIEAKIYKACQNTTTNDLKLFKLELGNTFLNIIAFCISVFVLFQVYNFHVPPEIIAVNNSGSYFEKIPLDQPNKTIPEIKQWLADRIIEAFDYNFTNQTTHATTISRYYTPESLASLDSFINGKTEDGQQIDSMLKRKVNKEAGVVKMVLADGITVSAGKVRNIQGWQAKTSGALVLYTKSGVIRLGRYIITIVIVRADESENQDGLKIYSIQMEKIH